MERRRRVVFAACGLVLVIGIVLTWTLDDGPRSEAVEPGDLAGTTWQIVESTGPSGRVVSIDRFIELGQPADYLQPGDSVIEPYALRLRFETAQMIGVEGCRDFAMSTTIVGTDIVFGEPTTDESLCTDPALRTQPFLDSILRATTLTTIDGLLHVVGPEAEMRFEQIPTIGDLREPEPVS